MIWRSTLGQTAVTVAASRADDAEEFIAIRDEVFAYLNDLAVQDDKAYEDGKADSKPARSTRERGDSRKTGNFGNKGGKGDGHFHGDLADALKMKLKFGAFEGVALGDLLEIDADEADSDYSYGDGQKSGRDYFKWLASFRNDGPYSREAALLVTDDLGIEVPQENE